MVTPPLTRRRLSDRRAIPSLFVTLGLTAAIVVVSCKGDTGAPGTPRSTPVTGLPGVVVTIRGLSGASGTSGAFRVGDTIAVRYTLATDDGQALGSTDLARGAIMVSGPTFNYQRVIASQSDLATRSTANGDGSFTYRFATPIPATYLAPLNDTSDLTDGELTGRALLAGTYTVGIEARRDIEIEGEVFRDVGNGTLDFLFGSASTIEPRRVVSNENCNQCHVSLQAHGGNRTRIENCLLCHTSGAEDRNVASVEDGTPGVSIDFRVMIHRIHAGATLPSVVGMTTKSDGTRDFAVAGKPYKVVGFGNSVHDFSHVRFPGWPSLVSPMPRDVGYTSSDTAKEDLVRSGPVDCAKCHGDPDDTGPLAAPAQGGVAYSQPSRRACASCHDDWISDHPYTANNQTMPVQRDDSACILCHRVSGTPLDVIDAHRHPLRDPAIVKGINISLTGPTANLNPGDRLLVTFNVKDDTGAAIPLGNLARIEVGVNGPTTNPNMLLSTTVPITGIMGAGPDYTTALPERVYLEPIGVSNNTLQDWGTARSPHWHVTGALTDVFLRTATGASSFMVASAPARQNYIDVTPGTGNLFPRDAYIVLEDAVPDRQEYLRVQWRDGDRLWFSSPRNAAYPLALAQFHPVNSTVTAVTLVRQAADKYRINAGRIEELQEFGDGPVLSTYTTDFLIPAVYPGSLNDSPDLDHASGDWTSLPLLSGTYNVGMWATRSHTVSVLGQTTSYTEGSNTGKADFLIGSAAAKSRILRLDSAEGCNKCHEDLQFHGGSRRGVDTCLFCHGNAGSEDRARHLAAGAPATTGVAIDFRSMVHKIHHGKELSKAYDVIGFGGDGYPNNYSIHNYNEIGFPVMPDGTANCVVCHGADNTAWRNPGKRAHPNETKPSRTWSAACITCHDSDAATVHASSNTSPTGAEACAVCHGEGRPENVQKVHAPR